MVTNSKRERASNKEKRKHRNELASTGAPEDHDSWLPIFIKPKFVVEPQGKITRGENKIHVFYSKMIRQLPSDLHRVSYPSQ